MAHFFHIDVESDDLLLLSSAFMYASACLDENLSPEEIEDKLAKEYGEACVEVVDPQHLRISVTSDRPRYLH
ncbi:MAG: hypothetical protein FD176_154 [Rhodospirillaceae bacterium]|nr:MAG: hypothetical protein FD176_154 [Rhodospirillaceae bacterium]TNC98672.1 MAG: hypothetical protein FD119_143 [Stygiobacter sp.]